MGLETKFKKEIGDSLRLIDPDCFVQKMHGNRFMIGVPDLIVVTRGVPIMMELKVIKTRPKRNDTTAFRADTVTPLQRDSLRKWARGGGIGLVLFGVMGEGRRPGTSKPECPIFVFQKLPNGIVQENLRNLTNTETAGWRHSFFYEGKGLWNLLPIKQMIGAFRTAL